MDGIYEKAHKMTKKICSKYKDIDYKTQFKLCLSYLSDENINKRIKEILAEVKVNEEVALKWLNDGAIPTDTVRDLLSKQGIMKKFHESKMTKEGK